MLTLEHVPHLKLSLRSRKKKPGNLFPRKKKPGNLFPRSKAQYSMHLKLVDQLSWARSISSRSWARHIGSETEKSYRVQEIITLKMILGFGINTHSRILKMDPVYNQAITLNDEKSSQVLTYVRVIKLFGKLKKFTKLCQVFSNLAGDL